MNEKILTAADDMVTLQTMCDVLEINFRDVVMERALSIQSFWTKAAAVDGSNPWHLIFLSTKYLAEAQEGFLERLGEINPEALPKLILIGQEADLEEIGEDLRHLPLLVMPFSLDGFQELVESFAG